MTKLARVLIACFFFALFLGAFLLTSPSRSTANASAVPVLRPSGGAGALISYTAPYTYYFPWVSTAPDWDLAFSGVKIMQGTSPDHNVPIIQNRPAIARAFVSVTKNKTISDIGGRMYGFDVGSNPLGAVDSISSTAPSEEGSLSRTMNFSVPANWLKPGARYYIELDPSVLDQDKTNNRYPVTGTIPFNATYAAPLEVMIVPILYLPAGALDSKLPKTSDLSYLEWMQMKVLPIPSITYYLHSPVSYEPQHPQNNLDDPSGLGWQELLNLVSTYHATEDPAGNKLYYGLVNTFDAHGGCGGCTTGLGWVGNHIQLPTAVGWSGGPDGDSRASTIMTHEMGHNFGREHVLCEGSEQNEDRNYPYPGGLIGAWGVDIFDVNLYSPSVYADFMSYCDQLWTSDYTFTAIKNYRNPGSSTVSRVSTEIVQATYVSGIVGPSGTVTLSPLYQQLAPVSVQTVGSYLLEILDKDTNVLAAYPFEPARIGDSKGASGFGFFVPTVDGMAGLRVKKDRKIVGEKIVTDTPVTAAFVAQAPRTQSQPQGALLQWASVTHPTESIVYRVRISRDGGATWQVLALDLRRPEYTVPADVDLSGAIIEVQASDGIHVTTRTLNVGK